jgi:flagellar basal-body rod protein FlgC
MDYNTSFAISAAGMVAEHARVDVAALNLANANTLQTAGGGGYQPMRVVMRAAATGENFASQVAAGENDTQIVASLLPEAVLEPSTVGSRQVYDPSNPFADGKGMVNYPGVDSATEMVNMMTAVRAYESNVAAMNVAKTLALKALDIGGNS